VYWLMSSSLAVASFVAGEVMKSPIEHSERTRAAVVAGSQVGDLEVPSKSHARLGGSRSGCCFRS